uniref:(northern house mosquito) hypothetical protein n=1 Tax=Culex pipiens TaxID=7175 RepID=A0A8D8E817_CULPI
MHVRARYGRARVLRQEWPALRLCPRHPRPAPARLRHQGAGSAASGRGQRRVSERAERAGQGAQPDERGPQVAGHKLRAGQLQDGTVQAATAVVPPGLRLPAVPQQQGQAAQPAQVQVQIDPMPQCQAWRRVGRTGQLRGR